MSICKWLNLATIDAHVCIICASWSWVPSHPALPLCGILWPSQQLLTLPESTTKTTSGMVTPVSAMLVPQVTSKYINTLHPSPVVPLVNDALTVNDMLTCVTVASSLADSVQYFHGLSWFAVVQDWWVFPPRFTGLWMTLDCVLLTRWISVTGLSTIFLTPFRGLSKTCH